MVHVDRYRLLKNNFIYDVVMHVKEPVGIVSATKYEISAQPSIENELANDKAHR